MQKFSNLWAGLVLFSSMDVQARAPFVIILAANIANEFSRPGSIPFSPAVMPPVVSAAASFRKKTVSTALRTLPIAVGQRNRCNRACLLGPIRFLATDFAFTLFPRSLLALRLGNL